MDSESSQDDFIFLKDAEKDLMAYEEEDMLAFEEADDSDMDDRSESMTPAQTPSKRRLLEAEVLIPPVGAIIPQPKEFEVEHTFETPAVDFDFNDGAAMPILGISMPSQILVLSKGDDLAGDIQEAAAKSPSELADAKKDPAVPQNGDSKYKQSEAVPNEPSQPPKEASPDGGHQLQLFHTDQMVCNTISIRETPETSDHNAIQQHFAFNGIEIAGQLLEAAAAQMEPKVIVHESTVMAIANGLQLSLNYGIDVGNPQIVGIGRMVADILLDTQTGLVLGFAVARLVPHPIINGSGGVQGSVLHQVTQGFAVDANSRRIISDAVGSAILALNQIPCE